MRAELVEDRRPLRTASPKADPVWLEVVRIVGAGLLFLIVLVVWLDSAVSIASSDNVMQQCYHAARSAGVTVTLYVLARSASAILNSVGRMVR